MAQRDDCFAKEIAFFRNFTKRFRVPIDNIFWRDHLTHFMLKLEKFIRRDQLIDNRRYDLCNEGAFSRKINKSLTTSNGYNVATYQIKTNFPKYRLCYFYIPVNKQ